MSNTDKNTAPVAQIDLDKLQRFNNRAGLMNPESNGLYVRFEQLQDLARAGQQVGQQAGDAAGDVGTPRIDALMAKWDDDGATRGSAFIELRDMARLLERAYRSTSRQVSDLGAQLASETGLRDVVIDQQKTRIASADARIEELEAQLASARQDADRYVEIQAVFLSRDTAAKDEMLHAMTCTEWWEDFNRKVDEVIAARTQLTNTATGK